MPTVGNITDINLKQPVVYKKSFDLFLDRSYLQYRCNLTKTVDFTSLQRSSRRNFQDFEKEKRQRGLAKTDTGLANRLSSGMEKWRLNHASVTDRSDKALATVSRSSRGVIKWYRHNPEDLPSFGAIIGFLTIKASQVFAVVAVTEDKAELYLVSCKIGISH